MKYLLIVFLMVTVSFAASQKYSFKDPKLSDEFGNVYKYLNQPVQFVDVYSFTKAEIQALTPRRVGRLYYCSDCSTDAVVVSTGTTIGAFGRLTARTTAIN